MGHKRKGYEVVELVDAQPERRHHKRFDMVSSGTRLARIRTLGERIELESLELLNLSQGGMCVRGGSALQEGEVEYFLMDLTEPFRSIVLVRAEGRWAHAEGATGQVNGIRILESSKSWLGTRDSDEEGTRSFAFN